ncbi:MAG: type I restriction enzyme HsdR N-terminal domain-containing protein, partial [Tannerella sp.]|nr:type I restriction enzyme HsdR N-terminal domain-containing protein [Tannerella sp.]
MNSASSCVPNNKGKEIPYISCLIRKREIKLTPEEAVRQLYLEILLNDYKYPADRIELEYAVTFGREKK